MGNKRQNRYFDWLYVICATALVGGLYTDGWAHHNLAGQIESFFTPWHIPYYGAFGSVAALLIYRRLKGTLAGEYIAAYKGVWLFAIAGAGDMVWHELFGIETSIDALLSPTHLLLGIGGMLMMSAPYRKLWTVRQPTLAQRYRGAISMALILAQTNFVFQFVHPLVFPRAGELSNGLDPFISESLGVAGIALAAISLVFIMSGSLRMFRFPPGTFTIVIIIQTLTLAVLQGHYAFIPTAIITGPLIDLLYQHLIMQGKEKNRIHWFNLLFPGIIAAGYTITILLTTGSTWNAHLLTGIIALPAVIGWLCAGARSPARGCGLPRDCAAPTC